MAENMPKKMYQAASLSKGQYDSWCIRTALTARQIPTTSLPGGAVFTSDDPAARLAFTQLGSYGATPGGFGLVKTSRRTWQVLQRAGIPVPDSRTFPTESADPAAAYARQAGYPVVVSSLSGGYRRRVDAAEQFNEAFTAVAGRVQDQIVVSPSISGRVLRFLVRGQQVLAVAGDSRRDQPSLSDVDPSLIQLAADALQAIPGLDPAAVTIATPRLNEVEAAQEALVERIARAPHLRDFAAGSRSEALRLADELVQAAAKDLQVRLAEPSARVGAQLDFTGVPDPEAFAADLAAMVDALPQITAISGPTPRDDGAELQLSGPASAAALIITRAIVGFGAGSSAHLVQCRPARLEDNRTS